WRFIISFTDSKRKNPDLSSYFFVGTNWLLKEISVSSEACFSFCLLKMFLEIKSVTLGIKPGVVVLDNDIGEKLVAQDISYIRNVSIRVTDTIFSHLLPCQSNIGFPPKKIAELPQNKALF
ncbi:MAG: hypothetical protein NTV71_05545, partial [Candidatus Omnitrophica bacterium]|nr:hypothetical protein [Candidatus Omnitrophota bacterium]